MRLGWGRLRRGPPRGAWLALVALLATLVLFGGSVGANQPAVVAQAQVQAPPNATLSVSPNPAHPGETIVFDARDSTAPNGTVSACEFDVDGDGTYDTEGGDCVVEYPYYAAGRYAISVRVTTSDDRTATASETLVVTENEAPSATIAVDPESPRPGERVTLVADATDDDGTVVTYRWRIDDVNRTGRTVETAFETVGDHAVSLTVVDDDGATADASAAVSVLANRPPSAGLAVDRSDVTVGESVRLDASGTTDPDGQVVEYRWDLDGDGAVDRTTADGTTTFEPAEPGEFTTSVTAVDDRDAVDTATVQYAVASQGSDGTGADGSDSGRAQPGGVGGVDAGLATGLLVVLTVLAVGIAGVAVRRKEAVAERADRLRDLLTRGDVRRRLAKKGSGAAVKKVAKAALRRFSDLIEAGGELVGNVFEGIGRAIKRASQRVAEWLRRLGS